MRYRTEIDGLRAVAVIPVILFHAGIGLFPGGFVGVDIFFVISGYLIAGIILDEMEAGSFSLLRFYERRARRILPALFLVMLVCLALASLWLIPLDLADFARSLIAVCTFSSNVFFWAESGYFATDAELIPLLHTWSLALEEQFYLLFPLLLLLTWRLGKRVLVATLTLILGLSFIAAQWSAYNNPNAGFFLLPTRAWELLIGVLTAFYLRGRTQVASAGLAQVASLAGVMLIGMAVFGYDRHTPVPGAYALVPTLGAALVIVFATGGTLVNRALSSNIPRSIGLISYSAYLWHQPLFAFARHRSAAEPSLLSMGVLCIATVLLAYFTWLYVEQPFRRGTAINVRKLSFWASGTAIFFLAVGIVGHKSDGFESLIVKYRLNEEQRARYQLIAKEVGYNVSEFMVDNGQCHFWAPATDSDFSRRFAHCGKKYGKAVIVLGDSHAMNMYNVFSKANVLPFMVGVAQGGCRPHDQKANCHYEYFSDFVANNRKNIGAILYHQSGSYFVSDATGKVDSQKAFDDGFFSFSTQNIEKVKSYLTELAGKAGAQVIWIGPFVEYRYEPVDAVFEDQFLQVNPNSIAIFSRLDNYLRTRLEDGHEMPFVEFGQLFSVPVKAVVEDCFMFRDKDHFSRCGEDLVSASVNVKLFLQGLM